MQLFICSYCEDPKGEVVIKDSPDLVQQLRKVLRAKKGYPFYIQDSAWTERLYVELVDYMDKEITVHLLEKEEAPHETSCVWMAISFPNKQEKLELIIQKLTEIWISHLYLWDAERSQVRTLNENKLKRIEKIVHEAVEQSRGWTIPKIEIIQNLKTLADQWNFVVFDLEKERNSEGKMRKDLPLLWIIGPEWWLSPKDYEQFSGNYQVKSLWNTVLRMETASIVGGRRLKNWSLC